jgi:hypothetical protein
MEKEAWMPDEIWSLIFSYLIVPPIGVNRRIRKIGRIQMQERRKEVIEDRQYTWFICGNHNLYQTLFAISGRWMIVRETSMQSLFRSMKMWKRRGVKPEGVILIVSSSKPYHLSPTEITNLVKPSRGGVLPEGTKIVVLSNIQMDINHTSWRELMEKYIHVGRAIMSVIADPDNLTAMMFILLDE